MQGFFGGFFLEDFLGRNFLGGFFGRIFWEDFLGGFFWENYFGRIFLFTLLKSNKLFESVGIDAFVKILSQWRRKEGGRKIQSLEVRASISL